METKVPNQNPLVVETEPLPSKQTDGCSTATYPAMMSEREALEMSKHGEVLTWSPERVRQASDLPPNDTTFMANLIEGFFGKEYGSVDRSEPAVPLGAACNVDAALDPLILRNTTALEEVAAIHEESEIVTGTERLAERPVLEKRQSIHGLFFQTRNRRVKNAQNRTALATVSCASLSTTTASD